MESKLRRDLERAHNALLRLSESEHPNEIVRDADRMRCEIEGHLFELNRDDKKLEREKLVAWNEGRPRPGGF